MILKPRPFINKKISIILELEAKAISSMSHLPESGPEIEIIFVVKEVLLDESDSKVKADRKMFKIGTEFVSEYF